MTGCSASAGSQQPPCGAGADADERRPRQPMTLLTIPPELLERILARLHSRRSWLAAVATCRAMRDRMLCRAGTHWNWTIPGKYPRPDRRMYDESVWLAAKHQAEAAAAWQAAQVASHALGTAAAAGAPSCVRFTLRKHYIALADALPCALDFTALRRLVLKEWMLFGIVPAPLQQRCPQLAELVLDGCRVWAPVAGCSMPWRSLNTLQLLGCTHPDENRVGAIATRCPPLPEVTHLTISGGGAWLWLLQSGAVQPQQLSHLTLDLHRGSLPPDLCQPDLWPALEHLELRHARVDDDLAAFLVALPSLKSLVMHGGSWLPLTTNHRVAGRAWGIQELVVNLPDTSMARSLLRGVACLPNTPRLVLRTFRLDFFGSEEDAALLLQLGARLEIRSGILQTYSSLPARVVAPFLHQVGAVDLFKVQPGPELWDEAVGIAQHRVLGLWGLPHDIQLPGAVQQALLYKHKGPGSDWSVREKQQGMDVVLGPRPQLAAADVSALSPARAQEMVQQAAWGVAHCTRMEEYSLWLLGSQPCTQKLDAYFERPDLSDRLKGDLAQLKAALGTGLSCHDVTGVCDVLEERFGLKLWTADSSEDDDSSEDHDSSDSGE